MKYGNVRTHTDRGRKKTKDEIVSSYYQEFMYKCSCSHTQLIPYNKDKVICSHCGKWIYKDKKAEFKDKMNKFMKGKVI